jgi:CubicO group peptidase (beta-lactamase class C family)
VRGGLSSPTDSLAQHTSVAPCWLFGLLALFPGIAGAQLPQPGTTGPVPHGVVFDDARARRVDSIFAHYDSSGSPGCAVAVIQAGRIRYAHGYGLADVATRTRIGPASVFGLASVTKQFTAFSIMLLARDGRLSLDDDVRKWVPELPDFGAPYGRVITIQQLVHHTSGIPNYLTLLDSGWAITDPMTQRQVLAFLSHQSLDFAPGARYRYSNSGYILLEMIVKRASGISLRQFSAKHIFAPLQMAATQFRDDHTEKIPRLASAYISHSTTVPGDQRLVDGGGEWQRANSQTDLVGDAGLYSTVEDLAKWDRNFYDGAVGGPTVLKLMQQPGVFSSGERTDYAGGLMIGAYRGLPTVGHIGGWSGYQTWLVRYPDQRFTIALLCNRRGFTDATNPSHRIAEIYLGDQMAPDIAPVVAEAVERGGADSAVRLYRGLRAEFPAIAFEEQQLNGLGYELLHGGKVDAAIAIFRLNVEVYPNSANTYDSLAEAYMDHGDSALAIVNYERSLVLNPANANATTMLAKLKSQAP